MAWAGSIEVHDLLHDEYDIQIEFGDLGSFLAYISIGDKTKNLERLIGALAKSASVPPRAERRHPP